MFMIAGLGNPGSEYNKTRHNVGFSVIDLLADRYGIRVGTQKGKALTGTGIIAGQKVLLVKPQTFMNLSGESLRALSDYYQIDPETEIVVICDDIDLPVGQLRLRAKGSAGGHNGLKNIIQHLGTMNFARIRVGVGAKPEKMDLADYVLGHFNKEDQALMDAGFSQAADAAEGILALGMDKAMNRFNTKADAKKKPQQ